MTDLLLTHLLPGSVDDRQALDAADLRALWEGLPSARAIGFGEFESTVLQVCPVEWPEAAEIPPDELGLRVGAWRLDLTKLAARTALSTVITGALIYLAFPDTPVETVGVGFIASIVGTVLEVERIKVSSKGRLILADLKLRPEVMEFFLDARTLYEKLPEETRSQLSLLDFADVVDQLRAAGEAEDGPRGTIRIRAQP